MSSYVLPGDSKVKVNSFSTPRPIFFSGAGVSVSEDPSNNRFNIVISAGSGEANTTSNSGTGEGTLALPKSGVNLPFKTIKAGTNVTITNNATDVTISSTDTGEVNTSSNGGTGGVGIVLPKSGVNLPFKSINAGSAKITVTDDTTNKNVDIDIDESQLNLANMGGTLGVTKGGTGNTTVTQHALLKGGPTNTIVEIAPAVDGKVLKMVSGTPTWSDDIDTGEVNTASNVGTAGVGVYKQKTGVNIELKKINAGSNKVTITDDTVNSEIDIDLDVSKFLKTGTTTKNGDASTTSFTIAHGFGSAPTIAIVIPTSSDALGNFITTKDATNITITYPIAPASGTGNLTYFWGVV